MKQHTPFDDIILYKYTIDQRGLSTYGSVHFDSKFLALLNLDILKLEGMNDCILVDNLFLE